VADGAASMTVYVALLRGVNVGGKARVAMAELRALFEELGFKEIHTFIQSGNVVFSSRSKPTPGALESAIDARFEITTTVVVRSASELDRVVSNGPFPGSDTAHLHVGFMTKAPPDDELAKLDVQRFAPEQVVVIGAEAYLLLPLGMGRSKLASYLDRRLRVPMTVRTWNTVNSLLALATA
jgi:uncharacterized protein (DUF1697 family)